MTLNITATTLRYVCQVSDRRLCRVKSDGTTELYTDQANKSTLLQCSDAIVAVTYHGIGEADTTPTDVWLVRALQKSNPVNNPITKVLEEFKEQSSEWINNIRRISQGNDEFYRHTFVFAGWVLKIPTVFYVSNYENLKTKEEVLHAWPEFAGTFSRPTPGSTNPCSLHAGGVYKELHKDDIDLLTDAIQKPGVQSKDIINIMVSAIQNVAKTSKYVSENCMSTLLLPGQKDIKCDYHSPSEAFTSYMPNIVGAISMWGMGIFTREGTPPWLIKEALPAQLIKSKIIQGMRSIPAGYKTGDALPRNLDPLLEKFLQSLPLGITEREILDAL